MPISGQYVPAGQVVGMVIPVEGQYEPVGHVVGTIIPVDGQYDPYGHNRLLPETQNDPAGQIIGVEKDNWQYVPAGHGSDTLIPEKGQYWVAGQVVGALIPIEGQ